MVSYVSMCLVNITLRDIVHLVPSAVIYTINTELEVELEVEEVREFRRSYVLSMLAGNALRDLHVLLLTQHNHREKIFPPSQPTCFWSLPKD
eukprot:TRINITY_DN16740_c0_g1_i1.p1 TRINITY_DN16740_c0_g1~~TRINITY_DN16740_c0_g1_i1.p1  ORF type:complete len:92 (-),score=6.57 TRINITY_DN16740_c0_g1_i1:123-398(-)